MEAKFDAAVNVVRSMPKEGINQSSHNKNLSTKERLFVFRQVFFSQHVCFLLKFLGAYQPSYDTMLKVKRERREDLAVNLQG